MFSCQDIVLKQIQSARDYTLSLLAEIEDWQWLEQPPGCPTHLAWQVGHLAMAEYGLCLFRQRGRQLVDQELMPGKFRKRFSRSSVPDPDPDNNPTPDELRATLNRVHEQVLRELPEFADEDLQEEVDEPYAGYPSRFGALLFCAHHEMLHAGQIGVLRRLLGYEPVR